MSAIIIIVVLIAAVAVGGYIYVESLPSSSTVVIKYGDLPFFDSQQAMVIFGGSLNSSGINLQLVRGFGASSQIFQALASGSIDMAAAAVTPPAVTLLNQGVIKILTVGAVTKGGYNASESWGLVVSPQDWSQGIRNVSQLVAPKTIADAAVGTTGEVDIQIYAQNHGLNFSDFSFTHITSPSGLVSAVVTNKVDAVIFSLPYPLTAQSQGAHIIAWDTQLLPAGNEMPVTELFVSTAFYNAHPAVAKDFLNIWVSAAQTYNQYWQQSNSSSSKQQIAQQTAEFIGGSFTTQGVLAENPWPYIEQSGGTSIGILNVVQSAFLKDGLITSSGNVSNWIIPGVTPTLP